ncbi:MAG: pyridoxamine 5'-phosphate oxidase [Gammaproteobacteria bacterium]|nr:pyridoxamine 5'-phosphate oxidase [Gammaproteobacteria bacterium]
MSEEEQTLVFDESGVERDPIRQLAHWFEAARGAGIDTPEAMVLATAGADGYPSARYVLLKDYDEQGFVFFTHTGSVKGRHLAENPRAALVFYWATMHRQIRVEGNVEPVSAGEADDYFASRPYGSRISAWVAPQSSVVRDREFLERRFAEFDRKFEGGVVPRPETWSGYRVRPETVEFWQGRDNRLHDRIRYRRGPEGMWIIERLAP